MAVGDNLYIGTDDARILRLNDGSGLLEPMAGFDAVAGRDRWFAGSAVVNGQLLGPPLGIRSVAANADGSVLFANVHVGGIPRSLDGGTSWQPTIDIQTDVHEVRAHPEDPMIVVAAASAGLCLSRDAGATWNLESEGLHDPHCYAVAFCGEDIFISAAIDPFAADGRVYRRPVKPGDARRTLVAVEGGLPSWTEGNVDTGCIATDGAFMAMVDRGGCLYRSEDFGRSWTCSVIRMPHPSGVLIC